MVCNKGCRIVVAAVGAVIMMTGISDGETAAQLARPAQRPAGAPRYSDVSMRLFQQKKDRSELAAAKAFHITRADWSYIKDSAYIKMVHELGWTFQGSMNAVTHNAEHAMRDKSGKPVLDHFGKAGRYWADNDNKAYRTWYLKQLQEWIDAGVDSIQRDEPTTCRRTPVSDAARFLGEIHAAFEQQVGRHVPMSCNLAWNNSMFGGAGEPVASLFDFGMAEMGRDKVKPDFLWNASRNARERERAMVYTSFQNLGVDNYRLMIAGCYATGMHFMVPWDQFGGVNKPRVFSRPEDMADLYGFVRANAALLDGYEDAAAVGYRLMDPRCSTTPVLSLEGAERVGAFVRARPGDATAPVVVHLIEWGKPGAFKVRLHARDFFKDGDLAVALHTPAPYDRQMHENAEISRQYTSLSCSSILQTAADDGWLTVEIPALKPWGMLVVTGK